MPRKSASAKPAIPRKRAAAASAAPHAAGPLWRQLRAAPRLADARAARRRLDELLEGAPRPAPLPASAAVTALLAGLAEHSPYLWRLCTRDPTRLARLLMQPPATALAACLRALDDALAGASDEGMAMRGLRQAKQEAALLVALCDIGGAWDLAQVTAALTRFADAAVAGALGWLLRHTPQAAATNPADACGLTILALGKQGAGELNYSSDIDLVVFFDPDAPALAPHADAQRFCVRLVKALARLLQEPTEDGYVLRVDLRLRPDPGSTSVAVALPAAINYYETLGQNWERAAFIKARPVAGDIALGREFLAELTPFIWRKYFDYAAIADVHAMKRQIHAVRGHSEIAVAGHDIKLGRGGIREIEFFVQTQQLIFGGRRPGLRGPRTLDMLVELHADNWVGQAAVDDLGAAYAFLRGVEHRLQMVADEQTQRLPENADALGRFALFCGFADAEAFGAELHRHLSRVEHHYARLFEHAPGLDTQAGALVFTGVDDDPATLATLNAMGFCDAPLAAETVRGWHFGRRAAVQTARAREVLTELVPALLEAFAGSGEPDAALAAFDRLLQHMSAAVELFSMLKSNAALRGLFADILGGAPRLAEIVAARPHVLDVAIDPVSLSGTLAERVARHLPVEAVLETFLERARGFVQEQKFLIGVRLLSGDSDAAKAARDYTELAEAVIVATLRQVETAFARDHGAVAGGRCAVLGFGKLGSREMTASSDLDLVLVYDFDEAAPDSSGPRPLHATQYYTRLTQRLVAALAAPLRNGRLYDVDLRLRPSGGKGPVAVQLRGFASYQENEAETWEHMALARARAVAGDAGLGAALSSLIARIVTLARDPERLAFEVRSMRALIAQEKGDDNPHDLKLARGGLIDLEFMAQYLVLAHGARLPALVSTRTSEVLDAAGRLGLVAAADSDTLAAAHALFSTATQITRLTVGDTLDPMTLATGVKARIARLCGYPDFPHLDAELTRQRKRVRAIFDSLLGASETGRA